MSELIDRQAALKALRKCQTYLYDARDPELKIELSSAEAAISNLPTIQPEKAQLSQEGTTKDAISRRAALDIFDDYNVSVENGELEAHSRDRKRLCELPPAQPEPTDIDAKEAVYNLAEKIGIHQLFALTVELRGEPIQPELTYEQVEEYCKKRCLHVVTADFFESTKPQRLGHWIKHIDPFDGEQYECSECGVLWEFNDGTPEDNEAYFCPKCGARMTISK